MPGAAPRRAVALYLEKSCDALAAMLGAVYAGDFYSVIDVRHPVARVQAIASALDPVCVVADEANIGAARAALADMGVEVVELEDLVGEGVPDEALLDGIRAQAADVDPLYVNFTSGSTGTPKGVVVSHRSVIDFIPALDEALGLGAADVMGNQAPFDFDVSVKDIYTCLATGARLQLVPRDYFTQPTRLMDYLADTHVTALVWAVSAMAFVTVMNAFDHRVPEEVRVVAFSGEVMPPKQLRAWQEALPRARFVNVYGPTEITCNCTYHVVDRAYADDEVIPMGRPFANERVFLVDDAGHEVTEPGCEGEVLVGGTCLALGYLGDPGRTAAAFTQNPLNPRWIDPVYRTGDLARYDEAGDLVYVGRKDFQIKHLGQRIELGDIEAAAHAAAGVSRACCVYDARRKRIWLFYSGNVDKDALVAALHEALPAYMVPGRVERLEALPLTKNGKTDRAALLARATAPRRRA